VRHLEGGADAVLGLVGRGVVKVDFRLSGEIETVRRLMSKYASVPMSLADACLVRMTELHARSAVLTLDRDFRAYRRNGRQVVPVLMAR
jgi:predicted nucleic acid-binding protein